jgi:hypothetical protein
MRSIYIWQELVFLIDKAATTAVHWRTSSSWLRSQSERVAKFQAREFWERNEYWEQYLVSGGAIHGNKVDVPVILSSCAMPGSRSRRPCCEQQRAARISRVSIKEEHHRVPKHVKLVLQKPYQKCSKGVSARTPLCTRT